MWKANFTFEIHHVSVLVLLLTGTLDHTTELQRLKGEAVRAFN
jgi:hypothetical protein